jgi:hypothetical protein
VAIPLSQRGVEPVRELLKPERLWENGAVMGL